VRRYQIQANERPERVARSYFFVAGEIANVSQATERVTPLDAVTPPVPTGSTTAMSEFESNAEKHLLPASISS
jgi:hypothetical protein